MDTNEVEAQKGDKAATTQSSRPKQIVEAVYLQVESIPAVFHNKKIRS